MVDNKSTLDIQDRTSRCQEISDNTVQIKSPLVSVHMITYNHEPFISQAIEGVLLQKTDFPIELIIGEDCSTDRTREIVLEYQKKFPSIIRVLISDNNIGMHNNLRRVYDACRGKYIAYCEGDDYWHNPLKLAKQVEILESHPDVGLVHSDVDWHYDIQNRVHHNYYKNHCISPFSLGGTALVHEIILSKYIVTTCTAVVRRSILNDILNECSSDIFSRFLMGDTPKWIEFAYRSNFAYLSESLATYRLLAESACRSNDFDKTYKFTKSGYDMRIYYANKYGGNEREKLTYTIYRNRIKYLVYMAYKEHRTDVANESRSIAINNHIRFSLSNWLQYIGSLNIFTYCIIWVVYLPYKSIKKMIQLLNKTFS